MDNAADKDSPLAGARQVAVEPMRQEALVAYGLLESAGMHPILAFQDESGVAHPIDAEEPFSDGSGLMIPVMTTFSVYVPEAEAADAESVLADARRFEPENET